MKIFIAAPWDLRSQANDVGDKLQYMGLAITSRWHDPEFGPRFPSQEGCTQMDLEDVDKAEALLLLDWQPSSGKMIEFGYAIAGGKQLFWWHSNAVGPYTEGDSMPLYSHLPQVHNLFCWEDLFLELSKCL